MNWSEQLTRIRRWVRDPNGNIFTDAFLLRLFNDELNNLYAQLGAVYDIKAVRIHPSFQMTYQFDWEYAYAYDSTDSTELYQWPQYYYPGDYVYQHIWEPESLKAYNATTAALGSYYTQPWEAWMATPYHPPPIPLPSDWQDMVFVAFDREEIEPRTKEQIIDIDNTTWKTNSGDANYYWRDSKNNNWVYIYPLPTITWQDDEIASQDPDIAEYADVDASVTFGPENLYFGSTLVSFVSTDLALDTDHNLLVIYREQPAEITVGTSETTLPEWLQKYVEYGTAERALRANTDGQLISMADYWAIRKKAGYEAIKAFKLKKMAHRTLQLKTQRGSADAVRRRHARLPSEYPDDWV